MSLPFLLKYFAKSSAVTNIFQNNNDNDKNKKKKNRQHRPCFEIADDYTLEYALWTERRRKRNVFSPALNFVKML